MMLCLILGDSIAVGTHTLMPECLMNARSGISSREFNRTFLEMPTVRDLDYHKVIISLGSNDTASGNTRDELERLRGTVQGKAVYWIMPAIDKPVVQDAVLAVAAAYGDHIVRIKNVSPDGVHPTGQGYQKIVQSIDLE
jgi:hypothetical protein